MDLKELKYLDLAISKKDENLISDKEFSIKCYFNKQNHVMHSNNSQINTLVDLIISLGNNLEKFNEKMIIINTHIHNCISTRNKKLEELIINLDYLKNQNNEIINHLNNITVLEKENKIAILFKVVENINLQYNKISSLLKELKHLSMT